MSITVAFSSNKARNHYERLRYNGHSPRTHHTDAGQRYMKLGIAGRTATHVSVRAPANENLAPPGHYMLFIVKANGVPSEARWLQVG